LSRELWWTGNPVAIFLKMKTSGETTEILGWSSPEDLVLFLKNFLLLWEMMHFENKIFYKIALRQKLLF
jgi:hypothetical protein